MQTEGFYKRVVFGKFIGGGLIIITDTYLLVLNYVKHLQIT